MAWGLSVSMPKSCNSLKETFALCATVENNKPKKKKDRTKFFLYISILNKYIFDYNDKYWSLVNKNSYIIVCDTIINFIKPNKERKRDWGKKNNPLTAIQRFLKNYKEYKYAKSFNQKLLISCNISGFIQRVR